MWAWLFEAYADRLVGYDTGQISGFLEMPDFLEKFADQTDADGKLKFSNWKSGLIVALVCFVVPVNEKLFVNSYVSYRSVP
jgi:hypothetical protein